MPIDIRVEETIDLSKLRQKIPINEFLGEAKKAWKDRYDSNVSHRLLKNSSLKKNLSLERKVKAGEGTLTGRFMGTKTEIGIAIINEVGTKGYGGLAKPIEPKKSMVLTVPNTRKGIPGRATAKQYPNAVWVPGGRDTNNPWLVELAPPKRKVGPNHKKPARWMYPSRKIVRVIMFGKKQINIRPKHFLEESFEFAVKEMREKVQQLVRSP